MNIPRIIANENLVVSHDGWPLVRPTFRWQDAEVQTTGRYDFMNETWVERKPEEGPVFENACYEDRTIMYGGIVLAVVRYTRASNLSL